MLCIAVGRIAQKLAPIDVASPGSGALQPESGLRGLEQHMSTDFFHTLHKIRC